VGGFWPAGLAGSAFLIILPIVLLFVVVQRAFVGGSFFQPENDRPQNCGGSDA